MVIRSVLTVSGGVGLVRKISATRRVAEQCDRGAGGLLATRVGLAPDGILTPVKPVAPSFFNRPVLPVAFSRAHIAPPPA